MSLKPTPIGPVPELTAYVARAAFPDGNPYLSVRDALGTFYDDERFAALFPERGQPAETPWRLALVTVLQFAEGLADRQAADAVRGRIDWKYALGLELRTWTKRRRSMRPWRPRGFCLGITCSTPGTSMPSCW